MASATKIDLNPDSHQLLLDALAPFLKSAASRAAPLIAAVTVSELMARTHQGTGVAKSQGIEVSARGRVPRGVIEKYEAAH